MTFRAVAIGILLGLFVAGFTYFNDQVIRQTMLVGHHLPVVVFGVVALLMLGLHPLLRRGGRAGGFRTGEIAVVAAIALAACGWPGNSFYRCFSGVVAMPAYWGKTQPHWIANQVFSFVPGGAGQVPLEHLHDAGGFAELLTAAADEPDTPAGRLWQRMEPREHRLIQQVAESQTLTAEQRRGLIDTINRVLAEPDLYAEAVFDRVALSEEVRAKLEAGRADQLTRFEQVRANRQLLVASFPAFIEPMPRGCGVLLEGGEADTPTQDLLLGGTRRGHWLGLTDLPWSAWWPTLRLWGGLALCMGVAALCLSLIVHPQWSRRELLPYPIAAVVLKLGQTDAGRRLPAVACHRGFWIGLSAVMGLHLINGLHAYFPTFPEIPLTLNFNALRDLFPNASRVFGSNAYFSPRIYPAVVAFCMFLTARVSFSLGIAHLLFMMLGALLLARGIPVDRSYLGGSKVNLMAFGSFFAMFCMIAFIGRRYYLNVAATMVGRPRHETTPAYARWAGWGLVLALCGAVLCLYFGGLSPGFGAALVLLMLLVWVVMSRISAETGLFLIKPAWLPVGIITALLGYEAIGPTAYIVMAVATIIIVGEAREAIMPFLVNALRLGDQAGPRGPARLSPWMLLMIVASMFVAGAVTLTLQHNLGINRADSFATRSQPMRPFEELSRHISASRAYQVPGEAADASGWEWVGLIQPEPGAIGWLALGFSLVLITAAARLRLAWWPLHPVIFLVWGTYPMFVFSFSLLLGWAIKAAVLGTGGARAYQSALPIAIGVILADVLSALGWSVVGALYFLNTRVSPPLYNIFPG